MKIAANPGWRNAAVHAVNRVLKRLDEPAGEAREAAIQPAPVRIAEAVVEAAQRTEAVTVLPDPARQRIRDAYIAARFSGVARSSQDFTHVRSIIKAADIYFADGNPRCAEELLDMATELQPASEALPLARLEIALRLNDSEGYRRVAIRFRKDHPRSARWKEITAFARTLYLTDAPFTPEPVDSLGDRAYLRPNWMQEGWELAAEFMPADLRLRVLATGAAGVNQSNPCVQEKEAA